MGSPETLDPDADRRRRLRQYARDHEAAFAWYEANRVPHALRIYPKFPAGLEGLTCGARSKRTGEPCRRRDIFWSGRCRIHGGESTGPKSAEGKARSAANGKKGGRPKKQTPWS
jgi:hypothetical protein